MSRASGPSELAGDRARGGTPDYAARTSDSAGDAAHPPSSPLPDWRAVDWSSHQRWVQLPSGPLNVIDLGSGPPVVFIHGLGGSWPNWLEQLPVLSQTHRTVAFDLPGFGASPLPLRKISIESYGRTVLELMDALDIESAAIVGNSMGGEIAAELALAAPQRVERIVLISPAGISTAALAKQLALIRLVHPVTETISRWVGEKANELASRRRLREWAMSTVATQPQRIAREFAAEQIKGVGKPGFLPALEAIAAHSATLGERLHAIACPTLILWGANDPIVTARDAEAFRREIPRARKVVWERTGHVAMFERAADFNALLQDFLRESEPLGTA